MKLLFLILTSLLIGCKAAYTVCPAGCDYRTLQEAGVKQSSIKTAYADSAVDKWEKARRRGVKGINGSKGTMLLELQSGDFIVLKP